MCVETITAGKNAAGPVVERGDHERLCGAAALAGDADPRRIHVVTAREVVERANRVPRLQSHHALQVQLGLRAEQAPRVGAVHLRARGLQLVRDGARDLHAVGVALHVVQERDDAHPGQVHGARLQRMAGGGVERLGPARDAPARRLLSPASWKRPPGQ